YRLAKSYEHLNFYPEALAEFKYFCLNYPESESIPESLFMIGKIYYQMGEFNKAIEKFKEYIQRFPNDKHIKDAYFDIGDCYFQMRQFDDANIWYSNALEKWPSLEKISKDNLFNLGSFYSQSGRYTQALKSFFAFVTVFPEEKYSKDVIYNIARSLIGAHQPFLGVKMLTLVISKYPRSKEAQKSALIMADIGIVNSKAKVPKYILLGISPYLIKTYDDLIRKIPDNEKREGLLFLKGYALLQKGMYRQSFNIYHYLLTHFFYERYKEASEKNIILSLKYLVNNYYSKGDYSSIYDLYCRSYKYGLFKYGNFDMLLKIGDSLKKVGLENYAIKHFIKMSNIFNKDEEKNRILLNIAEANYHRGHYNDAEDELKNSLKKQQSIKDEKMLLELKELLGDIYYREGLFKKAAHFYSEILESSENLENIADIYRNYADALMQINLYPSALINYRKVIQTCKAKNQKCSIPVIVDSYEGLGNCLYKEAKYKAAISMYKKSLNLSPRGKQRAWTIFNIGRSYMKLDNNSMAKKTFSILKEKNQDIFWPNLVDCYMYDKMWNKKYSKYLVELRAMEKIN
ncbi:MAG: tetratricopeptide repeat protein, partial [Nitrospiraceae bacterium]|nr:tetratricopeptide repeat protein [Nitrospiraceae bacterium]